MKAERQSIVWNPFFLWLIIILLLCPFKCSRADEPWYYLDQSNYRFMIPDKMQHFYGCYGLTVLCDWPAASLLAITKECMDAAAGHDFSINDLIADGLGIAGGVLLKHKAETTHSPRRIAIALDWRQSQHEIIFFAKLSF